MYNVINGILAHSQRDLAPDAYNVLKALAAQAGAHATPASVVLAWLNDMGISVVPRSSNLQHLRQNSPRSLSQVVLTPHDRDQITGAVRQLLQAKPLPKPTTVAAKFINGVQGASPALVYWVSETGEHVPVTGKIAPGGSADIETHTGHRFVAHNDGGGEWEFVISALAGEEQHFRLAPQRMRQRTEL